MKQPTTLNGDNEETNVIPGTIPTTCFESYPDETNSKKNIPCLQQQRRRRRRFFRNSPRNEEESTTSDVVPDVKPAVAVEYD